jgi:hypothetical protein
MKARNLSNLGAGREVKTGYLGIAVLRAAGDRYIADALCVKIVDGVRRAFDEMNEVHQRHTRSMVIRVPTIESAPTWRGTSNPVPDQRRLVVPSGEQERATPRRARIHVIDRLLLDMSAIAYYRWGVPSGRTPTTHILKPPAGRLVGFIVNEHLCLQLARRLEFPTANSRVITFVGQRAIVVERFDRFRSRGDTLGSARALLPGRRASGEPLPARGPMRSSCAISTHR